MNSASFLLGRPPAMGNQSKWSAQFADWRQTLSRCARKPTPKRVHELRVATLRLQAELEYWLRESATGTAAARTAKRWSNQARKLRRALSLVRETDVYLRKLARLRGQVPHSGDHGLRSSSVCTLQINKLEIRLRKLRQAGEKKLIAEIKGRRKRMVSFSKELEVAFARPGPPSDSHGGLKVAVMFKDLTREFPELNADCLHEFRKRVKKLRYMAEIFSASDPLAGRQSATLRKIQVAVGEWHDWHVLAQKADRAFRGRGQGSGLPELLAALAATSLRKAISLSRRQIAQMMEVAAASGAASEPAPGKFPVRPAESVAISQQRVS